MARTRGISTFSVAATYVGTVVGAGFATGQEVLRFFTHYGMGGIYGALAATAFFAVLGALILRLGQRLQADTHLALVEDVGGPLVGRLTDWVITFFLFGSAAVMMAGSGAVFAEHWQFNRFLGTALMALLAAGTVLLGMRGVVTSISLVAPILIAMVFVVSIGSIWTNGLAPVDLSWSQPTMAASPWWSVSMLLYTSYNLILSVAVLAPLGKEAVDERTAGVGGMVGGIALGLGALMINLALLAGLPGTAHYEVPMLYLAGQLSPWIKAVYSIVLWLEVYTTAVSSLFGLAIRLAPPNTARFRQAVAAGAIGALLASQIGFSQMVGFLFPAVGWVGLLFIGGLLLRLLRPVAGLGE